MLIKNIDRFFYPNVKNKSHFCRSCCNTFFSEKKYDEHLQFCNTNKTMILMPSTKKYLKFYNWQNTIKHNFIMYADIESYMTFNDERYNHEHLMSGNYLDCVDKKYSKKVQLFDKLEDFRDSLISELDYIERINKTVLNYKIDMSTFDQKKYDETVKFHTHEYFRQIFFNEKKTSKAEYYKISLKDTQLVTELQIKDNISNFNDKRYMIDNLTSKPHEINL